MALLGVGCAPLYQALPFSLDLEVTPEHFFLLLIVPVIFSVDIVSGLRLFFRIVMNGWVP